MLTHSLYRIWEYSYHNLHAWASYGINATLVPIGYAASLTNPAIQPLTESKKDIDVLFFGMQHSFLSSCTCVSTAFLPDVMFALQVDHICVRSTGTVKGSRADIIHGLRTEGVQVHVLQSFGRGNALLRLVARAKVQIGLLRVEWTPAP